VTASLYFKSPPPPQFFHPDLFAHTAVNIFRGNFVWNVYNVKNCVSRGCYTLDGNYRYFLLFVILIFSQPPPPPPRPSVEGKRPQQRLIVEVTALKHLWFCDSNSRWGGGEMLDGWESNSVCVTVMRQFTLCTAMLLIRRII
jgi:hypothetical protein